MLNFEVHRAVITLCKLKIPEKTIIYLRNCHMSKLKWFELVWRNFHFIRGKVSESCGWMMVGVLSSSKLLKTLSLTIVSFQ